MRERPYVSVVIATRNRERLLGETLRSLTAQDWPRGSFEIVVADNGSTDGTRALVDFAAHAAAPPVRYLHIAEPGKSGAVNAAFEAVMASAPSGPLHIIALTDDDVRPERGWIARLVAAFEETGADFVAGRIFPIWEVQPPEWMSPAMYGVLAIPDNGDTRLDINAGEQRIVPIGANMAVRAAVIRKIGGLRTDLGKLAGTLRTGEDHEFFRRMLANGYRGVYEPTAVVRHWVPRERLDRTYCRRWLYQNGRDVARLDAAQGDAATRLLGVPRYLWRQGVVNVVRTLARHPAQRFAASARVLWFAGYLRETWRTAP